MAFTLISATEITEHQKGVLPNLSLSLEVIAIVLVGMAIIFVSMWILISKYKRRRRRTMSEDNCASNDEEEAQSERHPSWIDYYGTFEDDAREDLGPDPAAKQQSAPQPQREERPQSSHTRPDTPIPSQPRPCPPRPAWFEPRSPLSQASTPPARAPHARPNDTTIRNETISWCNRAQEARPLFCDPPDLKLCLTSDAPRPGRAIFLTLANIL